MLAAIKLLFQRKELVWELIKKGIRLKYRHSYLGIIWSLVEPVLSIAVLVIIFGTLLGHKEPSFIMYVACGRLLYAFFMEGSQSACNSIRNNAGIIKKVYAPMVFFPIAEIFWRFAVLLISLLVLLPLAAILRIQITSAFLWTLPSLALLLLLTIGIGITLSVINVFFRDVEFLWKVMLSIIMYMSALFYYPETILKSGWAFLLKLNPLFSIIQMFRAGFSCGSVSKWTVFYPTAFIIVLLIATMVLYGKNNRKLVLYV